MFARLKSRFSQDNLEYEFQPHVVEIEETPRHPLSGMLIWLIFTMVILTFVWMYLGRVDEVAVARGKIIPDGRTKVIQPMESGVIRAIHVVEGQRVKEGQLLIELDPTIKQADAESTVKTLEIHVSNKERLLGELNGKGMSPTGENRASGIEKLQRQLQASRELEYKAKEDAQILVVAQKEKALNAAVANLTRLQKLCSIARQQESAYRQMSEKGYVAKMSLLDKQKELYTTEQELEAQKNTVDQARDGLEESKKALVALPKERENVILSDILENGKNISAVEGEVTKAKKKLELERLCSPVDGTVHGLSLYTIGGVATPAQPVATIVPDGTPLIVECSVLNKDIGFVEVGQEAELKLDTFPFQKYGTIKGKVRSISPDVFEDEKLGSIYKSKVELMETGLMVDGKEVPVAPGMALSVEIKTDKRRIIEFFLSPLVKYGKESLTLR